MLDNPLASNDRRFVNALARGLDILRCYRPGEISLSNTEIARRTSIPKPTVSRLTYTLTQLGYLSYVSSLGQYRLAGGVLALGYAMLSNIEVRHIAQQAMQELAQDVGASVALAVRDRLEMIYVENCRTTARISLYLGVGSRIPLATTAIGKALLSITPESDYNYLMNHIRLSDEKNWPRIKRDIEQAQKDIQDRGFCITLGTWDSSIHSVGVPLLDIAGGQSMAFNCGGPSYLLPEDILINDIGPKLVNLVRQVERDLGRT